jgi:hypothetical protein
MEPSGGLMGRGFMTSRRVASFGLASLLAAALAGPALAWGHTGHGIVNALAVESLPEGPLKVFFTRYKAYVTEHAIDPDHYKETHKKEEGPRHYLNMCEGGMKAEDYPHVWLKAVSTWGLHTATKQGTLPWAIQETYDQLVAAFKAKDGSKIVERATWLGHYVGDAHVPFHACANHDGQLTGQKGIHSMWEENMIAHNLDEVRKEAAKLASQIKVAEVPGSVTDWAFERLVAGDHYAHDILAKDKGTRTSGREKALFKTTGAIAEKRLAEAATGLASLWLTAWTKAGKPALPADVKLPDGVAAPGKAGDDSERGEDEKPAADMPKADAPKADAPKADAPEEPKPAKPEAPKVADKPSPDAVAGPVAGLMVRDDDAQPGAVIDVIEASSAAATAGLTRGDVIVAVDGAPVNSVSTLRARWKDYKSGDQVPVTYLRAGQESFARIRMP